MKQFFSTLLITSLLFSLSLRAQQAGSGIERVIVETYYVADAADVSAAGSRLTEGAVTYRIYLDLASNATLDYIYGDANHSLKIISSAAFYNDSINGKCFADKISNSKIKRGKAALDSYLTLGAATSTYFGVLKEKDNNGSILSNFKNYASTVGIPLDKADGFAEIQTQTEVGFSGFPDDIDSTVFGQLTGNEFISNTAVVTKNDTKGLTDDNIVLVAQLTTAGKLEFELNAGVSITNGAEVTKVRYVAVDNGALEKDEKVCAELKYPRSCGCRDFNYVEYNTAFGCDEAGACKTLIVFGCTDRNACNYDPNANTNLQELCCYPGKCQDRDLSLTCPILDKKPNQAPKNAEMGFNFYPNPATTELTLEFALTDNIETAALIYDAFGKIVIEKNISAVSGDNAAKINISNLSDGFYFLRVFAGNASITRKFIKN